jgi:hypothetical protein
MTQFVCGLHTYIHTYIHKVIVMKLRQAVLCSAWDTQHRRYTYAYVTYIHVTGKNPKRGIDVLRRS